MVYLLGVMQRRGFFGYLAALPGLSFLGDPAPAEASVEPPTVICTTVAELFQRILDFVNQYPGAKVLACNDPPNLLTGFTAFVIQEGLEISLVEYLGITRLKETSPGTIRKAFASGAGRSEVAHILSKGGSLEDVYWRIYNLPSWVDGYPG